MAVSRRYGAARHGTQPLWFGHLPRDAVRVGELHVGPPVNGDSTGQTYRVRVGFEVPAVEDGRYAVWVCRAACGANSGFGDLVYGHIVVARTGQPGDEDAPRELAVASAQSAAGPTEDGGFPWSVVAPVVLASAVLAGASLHRVVHDAVMKDAPAFDGRGDRACTRRMAPSRRRRGAGLA